MSSGLARQRGVALITALLITALVTVVAVAMASRQQLDIRRTGNILQVEQAWHYARGVEAWARQVLAKDDPAHDGLNYLEDPWAASVPPLPVEGGSVQGTVEDLQGRFNLNNLLKADGKPDPAQIRLLQNLFALLAATNDQLKLSPFLSDALVDWIDGDLNLYANGAEDQEYLALTPPYRAANREMVSPSELLAVAGFTPALMAELRPLVATLPRGSKINVNTAPELVLMSLEPNITPSMAQAIVAERSNKYFASAQEFKNYMQREHKIAVDEKLLDVKSSYFLVDGVATIGRTHVELYSLLERTPQRKIVTLRRSIGTY